MLERTFDDRFTFVIFFLATYAILRDTTLQQGGNICFLLGFMPITGYHQ
jgi:hypothetical protein